MGGNDPRFQPMYWEDKDLFMRMQMEGYKFVMTSKSLIWHFTSRTSRFLMELKTWITIKDQHI